MANSYKNIIITPNIGSSTDDPKIVFSGANTTTNTDITVRMYPTSNGTMSFEGSAGQLMSITNSLSGTIYSVNDVSGIPSIEVLDTGLVKLAQYSGNVVLGGSASDGTSKLQVFGSANVTSFRIQSYGEVVNTSGIWVGPSRINATNDTSTASDFYPVFVAATGSNQVPTSSSSKLYFRPSTGQLSATDFNTLSDLTYKENINPINNALNKILGLRGVSYEMKDSKRPALGVIAQEIEHIIPESVSENDNGLKSVSYNHIIAVLIEAIKEQQKIIDDINQKIKKL